MPGCRANNMPEAKPCSMESFKNEGAQAHAYYYAGVMTRPGFFNSSEAFWGGHKVSQDALMLDFIKFVLSNSDPNTGPRACCRSGQPASKNHTTFALWSEVDDVGARQTRDPTRGRLDSRSKDKNIYRDCAGILECLAKILGPWEYVNNYPLRQKDNGFDCKCLHLVSET